MSAEHGSSHGHDGPPIPPEPQTPMWLPALGALLFLGVGLLWAVRPTPPAPIAQDAAAAAAADAGAGAVAVASAVPSTMPVAPAAPPRPVALPGAPGAPGADGGRGMSPEQEAQLKKMLQGIGH